jgi:BirA family transcriptional regulator, biotin operon repressor / biotin---[acetyl-CoA-carboxylase] ligase
LAEPTFDRSVFFERLATRRIGRTLIARAEVDSTNDVAWQALAEGAPDGLAVVADAQHRGRGREGRPWHTAPGKGLALSILLHRGCEAGALAVTPLASGLALARACDRLGVPARLKWPNDLLLGARKVAGILAESRGALESRAVVVGVGVNVAQAPSDFPPELGDKGVALAATSLAIEGFTVTREAIAAEFANALESLWTAVDEQGPAAVIRAWSERASFWGEEVHVRTPAGTITGIARSLDADGALVLELAGGGRVAVIAGDVRAATQPARP